MDPLDPVPVLVLGAGPAGLAAALELARRDVPVLVAERRTTLSSHPRATALSLRSVELVRAWGLEHAVRERADDVAMTMLETPTLHQAARGTPIEVGLPSGEQSRVLSPVEPLCVAQDEVEPLLLARLRELSSARVRLGVELVDLLPQGDGALAVLRDVRTGARTVVEARYVVAADGARSTARSALGVAMQGADDVMSATTTLIRAPLWQVVGGHRHLLYVVTDDRAGGIFLPAGSSDRWLYGAEAEPGGRDPRRTRELVRLGAGVPGLPVEVLRTTTWSSAAQLAEAFRDGPVFLAGDAAHRVTPRGGTGLNTALHDGFDLGWKLAWVLRGWARPALLDTYEAERRPVAAHNVERSADPMGSRRAPAQEVHTDLGGRLAHVWSHGRSTLDLLGLGLTLVAGPDGPDWEAAAPAASQGVPIAVERLEAIAARAVGAVGAGALLVRPDGRPAAVLPAQAPGDHVTASLRRAVDALTGFGAAAAARGGRLAMA